MYRERGTQGRTHEPAGANHQVMKGYSFVPSPSANLVGVEKKTKDHVGSPGSGKV